MSFCLFFFFQAEDGIRDLVRSRGLGDVYKRQQLYKTVGEFYAEQSRLTGRDLRVAGWVIGDSIVSVSYTHLTLPTSDLV